MLWRLWLPSPKLETDRFGSAWPNNVQRPSRRTRSAQSVAFLTNVDTVTARLITYIRVILGSTLWKQIFNYPYSTETLTNREFDSRHSGSPISRLSRLVLDHHPNESVFRRSTKLVCKLSASSKVPFASQVSAKPLFPGRPGFGPSPRNKDFLFSTSNRPRFSPDINRGARLLRPTPESRTPRSILGVDRQRQRWRWYATARAQLVCSIGVRDVRIARDELLEF